MIFLLVDTTIEGLQGPNSVYQRFHLMEDRLQQTKRSAEVERGLNFQKPKDDIFL